MKEFPQKSWHIGMKILKTLGLLNEMGKGRNQSSRTETNIDEVSFILRNLQPAQAVGTTRIEK